MTTERRQITDKLPCPYCGHRKSKVEPFHPTVDDYLEIEGYGRLRRCLGCFSTFKTDEIIIGISASSSV